MHRLSRTLPYMQETLHTLLWWCKNRRYTPTFAFIKPSARTKEFNMSSVICRARYCHFLLKLLKKSKINPFVGETKRSSRHKHADQSQEFSAKLAFSIQVQKLKVKSKINNDFRGWRALYQGRCHFLNFYLNSITPWFIPSFGSSRLPILCCDQFSKLSRSWWYLKVTGVFWFTTFLA